MIYQLPLARFGPRIRLRLESTPFCAIKFSPGGSVHLNEPRLCLDPRFQRVSSLHSLRSLCFFLVILFTELTLWHCSGGLEMLFSNKRQHALTIPAADQDGKPVDIAYLIDHLCQNVMDDSRKDLFVLDNHL